MFMYVLFLHRNENSILPPTTAGLEVHPRESALERSAALRGRIRYGKRMWGICPALGGPWTLLRGGQRHHPPLPSLGCLSPPQSCIFFKHGTLCCHHEQCPERGSREAGEAKDALALMNPRKISRIFLSVLTMSFGSSTCWTPCWHGFRISKLLSS